MKNFRKLSAIVLSTVFASMQLSYAAIDTGLGNGLGGAVIDSTVGGFVNAEMGSNFANLNFNGDTHVKWDTLNLNNGETLNFNAVDGANGLTILNTVNHGMSRIYGSINANDGISHLIISNQNGMLFDGAHFTTAGDVMLTTSGYTYVPTRACGADNGGSIIIDEASPLTSGIVIKNSDFNVGGKLDVRSSLIDASQSHFSTNDGLYFTAIDNPNVVTSYTDNNSIKLDAISVDGDIYITSEKGDITWTNGGEVNGNLKIDSTGNAFINKANNGNTLNVTGNVDIKGSGEHMTLRNADIGGDLNMMNNGGYVELGNSNVAGNANLTTIGMPDPGKYHHFVHVIGETNIGGDLNIESSQNIHIGGYDYDAQQLADGKLTVGGTLNAHATNGHITTTIDTTADKIIMRSDNYNILTDGDAVLTANEYEFYSNGYIGGIGDYTDNNGNVVTNDEQIVSIMENYTFIPNDIKSHTYTKIGGGNITHLETPGNAYIGSYGDMKLTGAQVGGDINLTAYDSRIDIEGPDVHATNINVGAETDTLKVEWPSRDYTLNYTNIRDQRVVTIRPDEEITYELANAPGAYNDPQGERAENTTFLIAPDNIVPPPPPQPDPDPVNPPTDDNVKLMPTEYNDRIAEAPINTPVAFAADLDDDENDTAVRKNVDGSVTVVRAYPVVD